MATVTVYQIGDHWPCRIQAVGNQPGDYFVGSRRIDSLFYIVRLSNLGDSCECRGFKVSRHRTCVHIRACRAKGLAERRLSPPEPIRNTATAAVPSLY